MIVGPSYRPWRRCPLQMQNTHYMPKPNS